MTAIKDLILRGSMWNGRRCSIKRIQDDGTYETDWYDITPYVSQWGIYQTSMLDNIFANQFQIENIKMVFDNSNRYFNSENDFSSLFYTFKQRYRTKFKIESFLYDDDDTEVSGLTFYGILLTQPETRDDNKITFDISHILKVLQLYPATGIAVTASTTAGLVDRLVKKEVNSVRLFDRYFEGADDSEKYQINSSGAYTVSAPNISDTETVWDAITRYSAYQGSFPYVNQSGNFIWEDRTATVATQWIFNGAGSFYDNDYGVTLRDGVSEIEDINNQFSRASLTHATGTYTKETSWTPGDGSVTDKYGEVTFDNWPGDNTELTSGEATTIVDAFHTSYSPLKKRWWLPATFIPHLNIKDRIEINYIGEEKAENPFRLGFSALAPSGDRNASGYDVLGSKSGALRIDEQEAVIIRIMVNLDDHLTLFEVKEI